MAEKWKRALAEGRCPFTGCDIRFGACAHLNEYLNRGYFGPESSSQNFLGKGQEDDHKLAANIDDYSLKAHELEENHSSTWEVFKRLRKYKMPRGLKQSKDLYLTNDQVLLLVMKYAVGLSQRQIMEGMGWTSFDTFNSRHKQALRVLRKRGFSLTEERV